MVELGEIGFTSFSLARTRAADCRPPRSQAAHEQLLEKKLVSIEFRQGRAGSKVSQTRIFVSSKALPVLSGVVYGIFLCLPCQLKQLNAHKKLDRLFSFLFDDGNITFLPSALVSASPPGSSRSHRDLFCFKHHLTPTLQLWLHSPTFAGHHQHMVIWSLVHRFPTTPNTFQKVEGAQAFRHLVCQLPIGFNHYTFANLELGRNEDVQNSVPIAALPFFWRQSRILVAARVTSIA